jgi:hypothetical protein
MIQAEWKLCSAHNIFRTPTACSFLSSIELPTPILWCADTPGGVRISYPICIGYRYALDTYPSHTKNILDVSPCHCFLENCISAYPTYRIRYPYSYLGNIAPINVKIFWKPNKTNKKNIQITTSVQVNSWMHPSCNPNIQCYWNSFSPS